jgi:hypothetical protein
MVGNRSGAVILAASVLAASAVACGGAHKNSNRTSGGATRASSIARARGAVALGNASRIGTSSVAAIRAHALLTDRAAARFLKDYDNDGRGDPARGGRDGDDSEILAGLGHPASGAQAGATVAVVKRYYAAAVAGSGRRACSMLVPVARRAMTAEFGRFGYPYARNAKTCQQTLDSVFKHLRHVLSAPVAAMNVIVNGDQANVLIGSKTMPAALVRLQRWHGAWLVDEPVGGDVW